jgi:uncharacterized protein (DUF488 family)
MLYAFFATDNGQHTTDSLCYIAAMSTKVSSKITEPTLYSIGHGNRGSETFLTLLQDHGIKFLADVRSYPSSRRNPHFDRKNLEYMLSRSGISYTWLPDLGGFRREGLGNESPHVALESSGFRNYADYMDTEPFQTSVYELSQLSTLGSTCYMCAETLPQKCHRSLLADYLLMHGVATIHILDGHRTTVHKLSPLATVSQNRIIYNRTQPVQMELNENA